MGWPQQVRSWGLCSQSWGTKGFISLLISVMPVGSLSFIPLSCHTGQDNKRRSLNCFSDVEWVLWMLGQMLKAKCLPFWLPDGFPKHEAWKHQGRAAGRPSWQGRKGDSSTRQRALCQEQETGALISTRPAAWPWTTPLPGWASLPPCGWWGSWTRWLQRPHQLWHPAFKGQRDYRHLQGKTACHGSSTKGEFSSWDINTPGQRLSL